jgi:ABC-type multidrug transport system fused ATPase/permease subunit
MTFWLTILTIFALLFEVFGLAMIFPVISLLLDETFTTNNYILIEINNLMESSGLKDSPLKLLMIIISIYVTKTIFQLIITFQQKAIVTTLIKNLSNKLFRSYINQDYEYFTKNNKSRMIQFLQTEMVYFFNFFESLMGLIAEVIILIGIYTIILIIEPRGVVILTIAYLVFGLIYYKILNHRIKIWGNLRLKIDQTLSKLIL